MVGLVAPNAGWGASTTADSVGHILDAQSDVTNSNPVGGTCSGSGQSHSCSSGRNGRPPLRPETEAIRIKRNRRPADFGANLGLGLDSRAAPRAASTAATVRSTEPVLLNELHASNGEVGAPSASSAISSSSCVSRSSSMPPTGTEKANCSATSEAKARAVALLQKLFFEEMAKGGHDANSAAAAALRRLGETNAPSAGPLLGDGLMEDMPGKNNNNNNNTCIEPGHPMSGLSLSNPASTSASAPSSSATSSSSSSWQSSSSPASSYRHPSSACKSTVQLQDSRFPHLSTGFASAAEAASAAEGNPDDPDMEAVEEVPAQAAFGSGSSVRPVPPPRPVAGMARRRPAPSLRVAVQS